MKDSGEDDRLGDGARGGEGGMVLRGHGGRLTRVLEFKVRVILSFLRDRLRSRMHSSAQRKKMPSSPISIKKNCQKLFVFFNIWIPDLKKKEKKRPTRKAKIWHVTCCPITGEPKPTKNRHLKTEGGRDVGTDLGSPFMAREASRK